MVPGSEQKLGDAKWLEKMAGSLGTRLERKVLDRQQDVTQDQQTLYPQMRGGGPI